MKAAETQLSDVHLKSSVTRVISSQPVDTVIDQAPKHGKSVTREGKRCA